MPIPFARKIWTASTTDFSLKSNFPRRPTRPIMIRTATLAIVLSLLVGGPARAEVGVKDFQIIGRTLSLLSSKPTGRFALAIVYAPDVATSRQEAEGIQSVLGSGLTIGGLTLVPSLVPVGQLQGLEGAGAVFVTQGLGNRHGDIFAATSGRRLLSITQDTTCVQASRCVLSLTTQPQVQIVLNRRAAEASQVSFASAFRLLVSEI